MKLIRLGNRIVNMDLVAYLELPPHAGGTITLFFVGDLSPVPLSPDETKTLQAWLRKL